MGLKIKVFGKQGCGKCKSTYNKLKFFVSKWGFEKHAMVEFLDMDTIDGMAEGAFHDVLDIPTTIFERDGSQLVRWDGEVPKSEEFIRHFEALKSEA